MQKKVKLDPVGFFSLLLNNVSKYDFLKHRIRTPDSVKHLSLQYVSPLQETLSKHHLKPKGKYHIPQLRDKIEPENIRLSHKFCSKKETRTS